MNEWVKQTNIKGPNGGTFPDAPADGTVYGRKDAAWEPVATPADVSTAVDAEAALRAAADAALASDITTKVSKGGDTMTGPLTLPGAPTDPLHATTKAYVDGKTFDIHALPEKAAPVAADEIAGTDSAAAFVPVRFTINSIFTSFKAAFDAIYQPLANLVAAKPTLAAGDLFTIGDSAASFAPKQHSWANLQTMVEVATNQRLAPQQTGAGIADANLLTSTGWYFATNGTTANIPMADHGWIEVFNQNNVANGQAQLQRFTQKVGSTTQINPRTFIRGRWYGSGDPWSRWIEVTPRERLAADRTYFVRTSGAGGNDNNDGLTTGTPFLTITKAITAALALDMVTFQVTIDIGAGTFAENLTINGNGNTRLTIVGAGYNQTTIGLGSGTQITTNGNISRLNLGDFAFANGSSISLWARDTTNVYIASGRTIRFGSTVNRSIHISGGAYLETGTCTLRINGGSGGPFIIISDVGRAIFAGSTTIMTEAAVAFTRFVSVERGSQCDFWPTVVFNEAAGVITASKYRVETLSNLVAGVTLPGTSPGTVQPGSMYNGVLGGFGTFFESAQQTITAAGALTIAHGLGVKPKLVSPYLQCTTADLGYAVGDEIPVNPSYSGDASGVARGTAITYDATNVFVKFGSNSQNYTIVRKDTGAAGNITNASWRLVVRAWAWNI